MTKEQLKQRCRDILKTTNDGDFVKSKDDCRFLIQVFSGHDKWELKKGVGLNGISVQKTSYRQKCFYLHRVDGTSTDISFLHSITNRTPLIEIKIACRTAILPEIFQFRDGNVKFGKTTCPFTGEVLTRENTHIDHYDLKFAEMFSMWIQSYDVSYLH